MAECVDGENKYLLLKDIDVLGPPLDAAIIVSNFFVDLSNWRRALYRIINEICTNEFLHKEGRVDVARLLHVMIEEHKGKYLEVVADDGVVEICIWL